MLHLPYFDSYLIFLLLTNLVAAQKALLDLQGAQYIVFNGELSGSTEWASNAHPAGAPSDCYGDVMGPYARASLFIGINPPWDPNPFFFELYHIASDCEGAVGFCSTKDEIFNLDFASAAYKCFGPPSSSCYVPAVYLDLENKTKITQINIDGELGYRIECGNDTWVGGASANSVHVSSTCGWVDTDGQYQQWDWYNLRWNSTTPVEYKLEFTNTKSSLILNTTMLSYLTNSSLGTMALQFSGELSQNQSSNTIELDVTNSSMPQFNFVNGGDIFFASVSGTWSAAATPIQTSKTTGSSRTTITSSIIPGMTTSSAKENGVARTGLDGIPDTSVVVIVVMCLLAV